MIEVESCAPEYLHEVVWKLQTKQYRLVQIHCRRCDVGLTKGFELTYSFDKDFELSHVRVMLPSGMAQSSIESFYPYAFLYENEIHDLFGLEFINMTVDYKGTFFRTAEPAPMANDGGDEHGK